jgi:hypothetical protein
MEHTVALYSKVFLDSYDPNDWSNAAVDRSLWEEIHRIQTPLFYGAGGRLPDASTHRYFMQIGPVDDGCIVAMGNPVMGNISDEKKVYLPQWILEQYGLQGDGEERDVQILTEEAFPQATKIVLRVVDSAFYNSDVKKELEVALTRMGVIKKGQLLHIPIEALDNFVIDIYVSELEPANIVLCEGEEVEVEFEEPVDAFESKEEEEEKETSPFAVETAAGLRPPTPAPADFEPMILPIPLTAGNVLGSDPSAIPEWRRGLAAPPQRRQQR